MGTVAGTNSSATDNLLALLRPNAAAALDAAPASPGHTSPPDAGPSSGGPATFVDLSDNAKAVLARAKSDQVAADQLKAFVEAHRIGGNGAQSTSATAATSSVGNLTTQDGSVYGLIVTPTEAGAAVASFVPTVAPQTSFASQLQAGGFTISATGDAATGAYSVEIDGPNGFHWSDQNPDGSSSLGSVSGQVPADGLNGLITSGAGPGNVETITFSENDATAANVTASSAAGALSVSQATARSLSATISIDFNTGAIQINGSSAVASSQSARLSLSA